MQSTDNPTVVRNADARRITHTWDRRTYVHPNREAVLSVRHDRVARQYTALLFVQERREHGVTAITSYGWRMNVMFQSVTRHSAKAQAAFAESALNYVMESDDYRIKALLSGRPFAL